MMVWKMIFFFQVVYSQVQNVNLLGCILVVTTRPRLKCGTYMEFQTLPSPFTWELTGVWGKAPRLERQAAKKNWPTNPRLVFFLENRQRSHDFEPFALLPSERIHIFSIAILDDWNDNPDRISNCAFDISMTLYPYTRPTSEVRKIQGKTGWKLGP